MASSDARPIPKKNVAYRVTFPIHDADGDLVTGATGLDSEVSIDGATFADCTNEATEIATASGMYYLDLTSSEMNGDTVAIIVKTTSSGAKTTPIVLFPEEAGDIRVDVTMISGDATAADNSELFFDGTGYAGTNNVIPTVTTTTTATNVTTVNGLAANVITAASIATGAIDADAIADNAIDAGAIADGAIDAATFAAGAINAAAIAADAITDAKVAADVTIASVTGAVGSVTAGVTVTTNNDKTGYGLSSAAVQAIWDALTSALTTVGSIGKRIADNLDAVISSRLASASYTTPPTAAANADAVWDEALSGHLGAGSTGEALNAAGAAGDPWTTALPGAYGAGSAGSIIGNNINATVSSRASQVSVDDIPTNAELATSQGTADDATIAAIAALNNLSAAQVNAEVDTALVDVGLTTTVTGRVDAAISTRASQTSVDDVPTNAELATALGTADDATLSAISAVAVTLSTIAGYLDTEVAAILADTNELQVDWTNGGRLDLLIDAIKVVTDALTSAAATKLALSAGTIVVGNAITGTLSTTAMTTDLTEATNDHYNGRIIIWTSGVLIAQATDITDYDGATKMFTFTAITEAPSNGDDFIIV